MVVCIDNANKVLWLHEDDAIKNLEKYKHDENIIVIDKKVMFKPTPDDDFEYIQMWDNQLQEVYLEKSGEKELDDKALTKRVDNSVSIVMDDTLINMDMILELDEKLNKIIEHLGL